MASIGTITGTLMDSGCKHIIPVRVSLDTMLLLSQDKEINAFLREKMRFCAHKSDLLLCVNKPFFKAGQGVLTKNSAYPNVISTLGDVPPYVKAAIAMLYHRPHEYLLDNGAGFDIGKLFDDVVTASESDRLGKEWDIGGHEDFKNGEARKRIEKIPFFSFMGFSLGLGYAHPSSGDNVVSAMIGGIVTVRNGHFHMCTGDAVMWYWEFEQRHFNKDGARAHYDENFLIMQRDERDRQATHERGNGNINIGKEYNVGKINVAYPKPFLAIFQKGNVSDLLDKQRVFGKALSNARPFDMVDILVCTQSI